MESMYENIGVGLALMGAGIGLGFSLAGLALIIKWANK